MNRFIKKIEIISLILWFISCDKVFQPAEDSQPAEDKTIYRYYLEYQEARYYSSNGELEYTSVVDNKYEGCKILSSTSTIKYEDGTTLTITTKYEYAGLICKSLSKQYLQEETIYSIEGTTEYLDNTYRHIRHATTKVINKDGSPYTFSDDEKNYDGKCINQSKVQYYNYINGEITPSGYSITTYDTNGLHQVGKCQNFDANGNLISIYSIEDTYLNDDYWNCTESIITWHSNGGHNSRVVSNYDDSNRVIESRAYSDKKLQQQYTYVYDGDNCSISGFTGDLTIEGVSRYIKVPY